MDDGVPGGRSSRPRPHILRIDGDRHRHPGDPARARWYAARRCARFALYLSTLGGAGRHPAP